MIGENIPLIRLGLSKRTRFALERAGIHTIAQLLSLTEVQLLGIRGMGIVSSADVRRTLALNGLGLRVL